MLNTLRDKLPSVNFTLNTLKRQVPTNISTNDFGEYYKEMMIESNTITEETTTSKEAAKIARSSSSRGGRGQRGRRGRIRRGNDYRKPFTKDENKDKDEPEKQLRGAPPKGEDINK